MNACFRMLLSKIYKKILLKFRIIQSRMIKRGVNSLNNRYKTQSDETEKDKIKGPKLSRFYDYHEQDHIILPALQNKNKSNFNVNFEEDSLFSFQNNKQLLGKINMSTILMHYKIEGKENKNHKYSNSTFSHIKTGHSFDETSQANSITYGKKRKKTIEAFYLDKILKEIQNQKNGMKCQQNNRIKWGANLSNSDKNNNKSRISIMLSKSDRLEQLNINFQGRKKQSTRKLSGLLSKKSLFSRKQLNNGHNIKYIKAKIILNELQSILQKHKPNVDQQTNLIKTDLNLIKQIFNKIAFHDNVFCIYRTYYFQIRSNFGKLLFFIGLELNELYLRDIFSLNLTSGSKSNFQTEQWLSKITRFLHYQIYYALLFEIHTLAMQTLLQLIRIHSNQSLKEYQKSEYFCQMLLKLSLYYNNKFYEQHALEYMGLCQYKMGDIEGARNLYENMGKISQESKNNFRSFYNQNTYIFTLKEYLFKGEELKFSENVRLIETIVFQPNKPNADESKMEIQKKNIEQLNCKAREQSPRDRLIISKISKKINEFKKNEQKLRNKKNGKIIEMLKQSQKQKSQEKDSQYLSHYYKQIKQINDSILSNKQKTGVKTKIVKTSSSSHQEIENKNGSDILISNLISKVIIDNKLVDIKKYNVVRSHETETWQKHKQKYKTESSAMIHKNIKYFKEFLNTLDLIFQEKVDNL